MVILNSFIKFTSKVVDYIKYNLVTIKDIEGGEELTVKYTFYDIKKKEIKTPSEKSQEELEPIVNAPMMETE